MSARAMLQLLLLVQAGVVAALAYAAVHWFALPWPVALLAGLFAVLVARLLISFNNFLLSAHASSATPAEFRLRPGGMLRLFGEEFAASMLTSSWSMVRARPVQRIHPGSSAPPVLLLHGYGCNSGYWAQLLPLLDQARISHASLDLEPIMGSIDDYVPLVAGAVERLCRDSGAAQVVIVAHSMGGLVARAYLRGHGSARIARVITLGTPHHGTSLASFGVGANARQMRRHDGGQLNDWLHALAASETPELRDIVTSLYTHHDNIVAPQTSSVLPGARNVAFGGMGHVAMGRNRHILLCILHELEMLSPES
jgi:triacylglycerol esterase/lipase EstA (alpha/beta hydrolase family)